MSIDMLDQELIKQAFKEGLKEWLDNKFMLFGKWTFRAIMAAAFFALIYFVLRTQGWQRIHISH